MTKNEDVDVNKLKEIIDRLYVHELRKIVERLDYCPGCGEESNDTVIDSAVAEIQALNDKAIKLKIPDIEDEYVNELRKIVEKLDYCSDCAYEENDTYIDSAVAEIQALNDKAMMGAAPQG